MNNDELEKKNQEASSNESTPPKEIHFPKEKIWKGSHTGDAINKGEKSGRLDEGYKPIRDIANPTPPTDTATGSTKEED